MRLQNVLSVTILILLVISSLTGNAQNETSKDTVALLDALFGDIDQQSPGGVLTIVKDNTVRYHKGFGSAELEHDIQIIPETIFEAGSVSKQFTAGSLLLLVMDDKVALDDDVRKYVPELPEYDKPITIRHLLNHTSGLRDWGSVASIAGWPRTTKVYTNDIARDYIFRQRNLNHSPGSEYIYSNSNYTLLVTIVERVSGQTLPEFTKNRIFDPLGMKNTSWRNNFKNVVKGRAKGYSRDEEAFLLNMPFENTYGHAALLTTTEDLVIWNEAWLNNLLGGTELNKLRIERGKLLNGLSIPYAAAVFVNEFNGFTEISHSGATAGYRAWLATYPEKGLTVAYLSNYADLSPVLIGKRVAELYLGKEAEPENEVPVIELSEGQLRGKSGLYKSENDHGTLEFKFRNDTLFLGNDAMEALAPDTLINDRTKYIFDRDRLSVLTSTGPVNYRKMQPWHPEPNQLRGFTGEFSSDEAAAKISMEVEAGDLYARITPAKREKLKPAFNDAFYVGRNKLYQFRRDRNGRIFGFDVSVPRARNVPFIKDQQ